MKENSSVQQDGQLRKVYKSERDKRISANEGCL